MEMLHAESGCSQAVERFERPGKPPVEFGLKAGLAAARVWALSSAALPGWEAVRAIRRGDALRWLTMASLQPFSGSESFNVPVEKVYEALTSPEFLRQCVPDLDRAEVVGENQLKGVVRPKFAFMRGTLNFLITVTKTQPGREALTVNQSEGIGAKITVESRMTFEPGAGAGGADGAGGCTVKWEAAVTQLKGLVSMAPTGLIRGAAEKTIKDTWGLVRAKIEG